MISTENNIKIGKCLLCKNAGQDIFIKMKFGNTTGIRNHLINKHKYPISEL